MRQRSSEVLRRSDLLSAAGLEVKCGVIHCHGGRWLIIAAFKHDLYMQEIPAFSPSTDTGETVTACSDNFSTSNPQAQEDEAGPETV